MNEREMTRIMPPPATAPVELVQSPDGLHGLVILKDDKKYIVDRQQGPEEGRRGHTFHSVVDFGRWLAKHADGEQTEILMTQERIEAVLDPNHRAPERVECRLLLHPAWQAFRVQLGKPMGQLGLFNLLRGFEDYVREASELMQAIRIIRLAKGSELHAELTETGSVKLTGEETRADLSATIPPAIAITTPVFQGVDGPSEESPGRRERVYDIELLVSVDTDGDAPLFTLTCPSYPLVMDEALRGVAECLDHYAAEQFLIGRGEIEQGRRYSGWEPEPKPDISIAAHWVGPPPPFPAANDGPDDESPPTVPADREPGVGDELR